MTLLAKTLMDRHYQQADADTVFSVHQLYYIQITSIIFTFLAVGVILLLTPAREKLAYLFISGSTCTLLCAALYLNLTGRHHLALWGTVVLMFIGPWVSIAYELLKSSGDFVPMVYLVIPIQITALVMQVKPMYWMAALQTLALTVLLLLAPGHNSFNWISIVCFVFIASMLSSITNYVLHKQFDRMKQSRNALERSERRLRDISIRDPLTGLFNRRHMDEAFADLFMEPNTVFSLVMLDVDHFKTINDTYGHSCGDEIIQRVSGILTAAIRKYDMACRYGGDEFLLILSDCGIDDALGKAYSIKAAIEQIVVESDTNVAAPLSASIGVAQCPINGDSRDAILKAVDDALYTAKQGGRNQVVAATGVYTASVGTPRSR